MYKQILIHQRRLWWPTLNDLETHWMSQFIHKIPCTRHGCSVLTSNATDDSTECAHSCILWTECDPHLVRRRSDNTRRWVNTEAFNQLWHRTRTIMNLHINKGIVYLLGDKYLPYKCLLDPCDMVQCRSWFCCRSISDNLLCSEAIWCQMRQKDGYITGMGIECEWNDCHGHSATPIVPKLDNLKAPSAEYINMISWDFLPNVYPPLLLYIPLDVNPSWHQLYHRSIMSYGIILEGGGDQPYSEKIFKIQKRVIRIITNSRTSDSCRELFKKLEILPLYSQYIFSLPIFVIKNIYFTQIIRSTVSTQD